MSIKNGLISMSDNATMSSKEVAVLTGKRHDNVLRKCKELKDKGIIIATQIEVRDSRGKTNPSFNLNKTESINLVANLSPEFTARIIKRWLELEASQSTSKQVWGKARQEGILTRNAETSAIKEFIAYATGQGSKTPEKYYVSLTTMMNKQLFNLEGKCDNWRNIMTSDQLGLVRTVEVCIAKSLRDGMKERMFYKDIFQLAKKRVIVLMSVMDKTDLSNKGLVVVK